MIVGLYTSVTGKVVRSKNLEIVSRNLANINTTGFKKNMAAFRTFMEGKDSIPGTSISKVFIDHSQGNIKATGNKLDIAIHGDGYFVLESAQGTKYSRNGHFLLNSNREIVNDVGWKLTGDGGVIRLPKNAKDILVNSEGSIVVDGVKIGKINIVDFKNKDVLKEAGNSAFTSSADGAREKAENYEIQQGFLESSNVNVIDEMVNLMNNTRSFLGNNRVNITIDRTLERLIRTAYTVI